MSTALRAVYIEDIEAKYESATAGAVVQPAAIKGVVFRKDEIGSTEIRWQRPRLIAQSERIAVATRTVVIPYRIIDAIDGIIEQRMVDHAGRASVELDAGTGLARAVGCRIEVDMIHTNLLARTANTYNAVIFVIVCCERSAFEGKAVHAECATGIGRDEENGCRSGLLIRQAGDIVSACDGG